MTDSNEPSYYEVALTNRQVMFSFVLLLSCLMAAFVSGVWLGRSGDSSHSAAQLESVTQETAELAGLEEFKFFSDQDASAQTRANPPRPNESPSQTASPRADGNRQPSTLAQDLGVESRTVSGDRSTQEQRRSVQQPPPQQPPPRTEPARSNTASSTGSGFTIQVFSTKDEAQAKKVLADLQQDGYSAYLSPVEVGSQTMYRVRIGPFPDRESARQVADRVNRQHKLDTWIPSSGT